MRLDYAHLWGLHYMRIGLYEDWVEKTGSKRTGFCKDWVIRGLSL